MGTESSSTSGAPNNISRRRVVAGAAWTVPAVMVASAAPAVAASKPCLTASFGGDSCKWPGSNNAWGYKLQICFTNTCDSDVEIYVNYVQANTGQAPVQQVDKTLTVPANTTACLPDFVIYCSTSSASKINIVWNVVGQPEVTSQVDSPPYDCKDASQCP